MHPPESSFIFFYVTDTLLWLLRVMNTSTSFELYLDCFSLFSFYSGFSGSWMPPPALSFILTAFRFFLFTLVSHARECLHQLRDLSWFLFAPFFLLWILMLVNSPTSFSFYLDSFWLFLLPGLSFLVLLLLYHQCCRFEKTFFNLRHFFNSHSFPLFGSCTALLSLNFSGLPTMFKTQTRPTCSFQSQSVP